MYKLLDRMLPSEPRSWLALGVFLLFVYVLSLVAFVRDLDQSQLFTALASGVIGSGFGSIIGYFFATSKGVSDNRDLARSAMDLAKSSSITVEPPSKITIEDESK